MKKYIYKVEYNNKGLKQDFLVLVDKNIVGVNRVM